MDWRRVLLRTIYTLLHLRMLVAARVYALSYFLPTICEPFDFLVIEFTSIMEFHFESFVDIETVVPVSQPKTYLEA